MKLTALLLTVAFLQVSATGLAQQVNYVHKQTTLEKVFNEIYRQTGYSILWTAQNVNPGKTIDANFTNASITEVLDKCLAGQPLSYTIDGKTVVIRQKDKAQVQQATDAFAADAPPVQVSGKVITQQGEPLPGATIKIKGTTIGTMTNGEGEFTLTVPDEQSILLISFQGYAPVETGFRNHHRLVITLEPAINSLKDVVILGYTSVLKKNLTGSVSSLTANQITRVQSNNLVQSLVGVPGVRVNGGASGINDIRIHGNRSVIKLNTAIDINAPTLIVDGMPYYGSLNTIDQYDIASIDILKDASSTALYGSKGANGVIIITTKKGIKGKTTISFDSYSGVNVHEDGNLHPMNAAQYIQFKRDANQAVGIWSSPADDPKIFTAVELAGFGKVDNRAAEDFYNELGFQTNNTLTITNGGEKGSQKISLNFNNNNGRGRNMDNYNRYLLSAVIDHQVLPRLKVGVSTRLSYEFQQNAPGGFAQNLFRYPPTVNFYDSTGHLIATPIGDPNMRNPYLDLDRDHMDSQNKYWEAFLKGYASYRFTDALTLTTNVSVDAAFNWSGSYSDNQSASYTNALNTASVANGRRVSFAWNNVLNYSQRFGHHSIDATGVLEVQNNQVFNNTESGQDISLSQYKWYNLGASLQNQQIGSEFSRNQLLSYVGRVQYGFKDRYLLTLTARADGASQLAPGHKWQVFPSAAAAWRVIDEPFMKNVKALSELKFRASLGLSGNSAITPYATQGSLTSRYTIFATPTGDVPYATNEPNLQPVPDLKWETTRTLNLGVDYAILNNRISGSFDYYLSNSYDLLNQRKLPYTTGFNTVFDNIGKSRNRGYEIQVNGRAIDHKDFKWNVTLSFYHNKEELVELYDPRLKQDIANTWFVGYPVNGVIYDYDALGIWQTSEANIAATYGRTPGEIKIKDLNGDGKIDGDDREIVGTERPTIQSSLITNMIWKQFDVAMDFYSEWGAMASDNWTGNLFGGSVGRYNVAVIDYWTPTNPTNNAPQPRTGVIPAYLSAIGRHTNNYIRLRNITLGYTFPRTIARGISKLRIYASATNPWQYWSYLHEGGLSDKTVIYNLGVNVSL